jgi:hypothetical protein
MLFMPLLFKNGCARSHIASDFRKLYTVQVDPATNIPIKVAKEKAYTKYEAVKLLCEKRYFLFKSVVSLTKLCIHPSLGARVIV